MPILLAAKINRVLRYAWSLSPLARPVEEQGSPGDLAVPSSRDSTQVIAMGALVGKAMATTNFNAM
jgi:hypothetical protein